MGCSSLAQFGGAANVISELKASGLTKSCGVPHKFVLVHIFLRVLLIRVLGIRVQADRPTCLEHWMGSQADR